MGVVRFAMALSGRGGRAVGMDKPVAASGPYTLTYPVVDLHHSISSPHIPPLNKEDIPNTQIPPSRIALHHPRPKRALVLPPPHTPPLAHIPHIHLRIVRQTHQRAPRRPPQRPRRPIHLHPAHHLRPGRPAPIIDQMHVSPAARDGEERTVGRERGRLERGGVLAAAAGGGAPEPARGAQGGAGGERVGVEEGPRAREEQRVAARVEQRGAYGQLGDVQRVQERVRMPINLNRTLASG